MYVSFELRKKLAKKCQRFASGQCIKCMEKDRECGRCSGRKTNAQQKQQQPKQKMTYQIHLKWN